MYCNELKIEWLFYAYKNFIFIIKCFYIKNRNVKLQTLRNNKQTNKKQPYKYRSFSE